MISLLESDCPTCCNIRDLSYSVRDFDSRVLIGLVNCWLSRFSRVKVRDKFDKKIGIDRDNSQKYSY